MNQKLSPGQLGVIQELVGDAIAQEDLPALERAYSDFRVGMDSLRDAFENTSITSAARGGPFGDGRLGSD